MPAVVGVRDHIQQSPGLASGVSGRHGDQVLEDELLRPQFANIRQTGNLH